MGRSGTRPYQTIFGARSLVGPQRLAADGTTRAVSQQHTTIESKNRISGCRRAVSYRVLGLLDTLANSYVDITSAYTGRFGVPAVGKRVFVSVNATVNGYQGIPLVFSARVPAV